MTFKHAISEEFAKDLENGVLSPLLNRVKKDDTLMLALRGDYINIYYRGGSLLKVQQKSFGNYIASFDANYNKTGLKLPDPRIDVGDIEQAIALVNEVPILKYAMDCHFAEHRKSEREFQQLVARENNCSPISNETEYFIVDIEVANVSPNARYDMLAVRWLRADRNKKPDTLVPVLIEMKYGSNSLKGKAGLDKHLKDADSLIHKKDQEISIPWENLLSDLQHQVNQLHQLGLLEFNRNQHLKKGAALEIDRSAKPELIFMLANNHPGTKALPDFLGSLTEAEVEVEKKAYELLFYVAGFSGYGMHRACMLRLVEFKAMVSTFFKSA